LRKFLIPRRIRQSDFASAIGMAQSNLSTFIAGRRPLTPRMAWALARELQTKPEYWMKLQMGCWLWEARPQRPVRKASKRRRRR
jgi:addiction module HigA family antidote